MSPTTDDFRRAWVLHRSTKALEAGESVDADAYEAEFNDWFALAKLWATGPEDAQWKKGWPANATSRIRFPDGVAFYDGITPNRWTPSAAPWVGVDLDGRFMNHDTGNFSEHPGGANAIFVAFHTMTLEQVVERIVARYGPSVTINLETRKKAQP